MRDNRDTSTCCFARRRHMFNSMELAVRGLKLCQSRWMAEVSFCDMPPSSTSRCFIAENGKLTNRLRCYWEVKVFFKSQLITKHSCDSCDHPEPHVAPHQEWVSKYAGRSLRSPLSCPDPNLITSEMSAAFSWTVEPIQKNHCEIHRGWWPWADSRISIRCYFATGSRARGKNCQKHCGIFWALSHLQRAAEFETFLGQLCASNCSC
jgi:hypothetical protein